MKVDGEHEDAKDDADSVKDAQLRDQCPKRDLQTELRFIDYNQRQNISWIYPSLGRWYLYFFYLPIIPIHPMAGRSIPSNSHLYERTRSNSDSVLCLSFNISMNTRWPDDN